ncbi:hypothetical protein [Streptomyces sp. IBSBF 2390]|uniref:hypothetical protein n=1 Tax=Streptomyces sp. IBSBF 2390 TaxID=2903533 RepID=UPI002FDC0B41
MSADRESHEMTQSDIAFLLADAADEVEIGIAPVQAVIRGGRRRRARRWALAATTALVLAGSTGATLAVAGLPGGHGDRGAQVATRPTSPGARHVYVPQTTELSQGTYRGKPWYVDIQVWGAPRDEHEADRQFDAMAELGIKPVVSTPAGLIGKTSHFVTRKYGVGLPQQLTFDTVKHPDRLRGTDLEAAAAPIESSGDEVSRLVVGKVATTAREVTCTWRDGRTTVVRSGPVNYRHNVPDPAIVPVDGYPEANWFVCAAPEGTVYKDVKVTK